MLLSRISQRSLKTETGSFSKLLHESTFGIDSTAAQVWLSVHMDLPLIDLPFLRTDMVCGVIWGSPRDQPLLCIFCFRALKPRSDEFHFDVGIFFGSLTYDPSKLLGTPSCRLAMESICRRSQGLIPA